MEHLRSVVIKFWIITGKLIGLIFIDLDDDGKFYCIKYYNIYSALLGVLITVVYPVAYKQLLNNVTLVHDFNLSLVLTVSTLRDLIDYAFMILAFLFQNVNRENMKNVLNAINEFLKVNGKVTKCSTLEVTTKYRNILCVGIFLKFVIITSTLVSTLLATDLKKISPAYYAIVFIPKLALFTVAVEFLVGMMILAYHLDLYKSMIIKANQRMKCRNPKKFMIKKNELKLCDFIENLSLMHSKIYKIYTTISGMYQFQLLILVLSNFFTLMIDMFYVYNATFFNSKSFSPRTSAIKSSAIVAIIFRCLEICFISKCSNYLSKTDTLNRKFLTWMNHLGRNTPFKNVVS